MLVHNTVSYLAEGNSLVNAMRINNYDSNTAHKYYKMYSIYRHTMLNKCRALRTSITTLCCLDISANTCLQYYNKMQNIIMQLHLIHNAIASVLSLRHIASTEVYKRLLIG